MDKMKDQKMKKIRSALALAGLFAFVSLRCHALVISETFANSPALDGWLAFGDTNLFQWNSTNQDLEVTWNSQTNNSYYYRPLGLTLAKTDSFSLDFDVQLSNISWSGYPALAIGLFNFADATNAAFSRPDANSPNLFEFDYYPDGGYGLPNVAATMTDMTESETNYNDYYFIWDNLPMNPGVTYHVSLVHTADATNLTATIFTNGQVYTAMPLAYPGPITDFRYDTISISSYEDDYDPLLATGVVGNIVFANPLPVMQILTAAPGNVQFSATTNWVYTLERTSDFQSWTDVSPPIAGVTGVMSLSDTNPPPDMAFYRVRATLP